MAWPFAAKCKLLVLLALADWVTAAHRGGDGCNCEAVCAQEIARLQAELRALRGAAPIARRAQAQVAPCESNWVATSDADVEAMQGCRNVGDLTIGDLDDETASDVTSLAGLGSLESAEKVVIQNNKFLKTLEGLEALRHVGQLEIRDHRRLANLSGLQSLVIITGDLHITGNKKLSSLDGLQNLASVRKVFVNTNEQLLSLSGLEGLRNVSELRVGSNEELVSLTSFEKLTSIDVLYIGQDEPGQSILSPEIPGQPVQSLVGLDSLTTVRTNLAIRSTHIRSLSGLQGLRSAKVILLENNRFLESFTTLRNLTSVDELHIQSKSNYFMTRGYTLSGLEGLTRLDTLRILYPGNLTSLAGLGNLASVRVLSIAFAHQLLSLAELNSITNATHVTISNSAGLSTLFGFAGLTNLSTLEINGNSGLQSLTGLDRLTRVGTLRIAYLYSVPSLAGLETLTSVDVLEIERCSTYKRTTGLMSLTGLNNLRTAAELRIVRNGALAHLTGLEGLTSVDLLIIHDSSLRNLTGLDNLRTVGNLQIDTNNWLNDFTGLNNLVKVTGGLTIQNNVVLVDLTALESLERVERELTIVGAPLLPSLDGLHGLTFVEKLNLTNLPVLQSVSGLRNLTNAWSGVFIERCGQLRSLEGLGALISTVQLQVQETGLEYLGSPFGAVASVGAIRIAETSWPSCVTPQERAALFLAAQVGALSVIPEIATWPQWLPHQHRPCARAVFGTFSCTRGHPCNFSLAGRENESDYTSVFISGRFTGCGPCLGVQGDVMEDGMVDLGYALEDEEGGLRSICRCAGGVARGPVAQLLLRGPTQGSVTVCRRGGPCTVELNGEALEGTDHVLLMVNSCNGDPSSGFAASWTAKNLYLLDDTATWRAAPPTRYQVCWRPPCSSTADGPSCPAPENRYLHIADVELLGAFVRSYMVVLGQILEVPNIGFGVADASDWMRIRRACGEANAAGTDLLETNSSGLLFDFGRLTEDRVGAGTHQLCWCQRRAGVACDAEWHFTSVSGDVRILCPAGQQLAEGSSGRCQACPAGRESLDAGLALCTSCAAGWFSPGGDNGCSACQEGTYAARAGSSACAACPAWQNAGVEAASCSADAVMLILLASFYLFVGALCAMLTCTIRKRLPVVDVSLDQGCTIVTTLGSHGFSNFGRLSFPAALHGTGHPGLDSPTEPFRARVRDAARLELLTRSGKSINRHLDTSIGTLVVAFPYDLYHQGWPVPLAFSLPPLAVVLVTLLVLVLWTGMAAVGLLGAAATALASTAASASVRWRPRTTPLEQRCSEFKLKLAQQPDKNMGRSCEKGPNRAIAVGKLHELLTFFRDFIRERTAYYLDSNVLRALTKESRLSYAEFVGAGPVEWFVSHFWGTAFAHFCMALRKHAETVCGTGSWTKLHYWVCFCSNNQFQIQDELGHGWADSSFYITLKSGLCRGTCMVLDDQALPLTRVWCIFELLQTVTLERTEGIFEGLLLCTSSGVLNRGSGSVEVAMTLARKVAQMDLETAEASSKKDADMIRSQVKTEMGSFDALNDFIRGKVREMLVRAHGSANQQFADVLAILDGNAEEAAFANV